MGNKVTVRYLENLQHQVIAYPHSFIVDEPMGEGDGLGPNPYDLLLSALGACTAMTLLMYAERKKIPIETVSVELDHQRTYRDDCVDCTEEERRLEKITRKITIRGDITDEQKNRLLEIAKKCPVHRTIMSKPAIEDSIEVFD
ncbi:MAG: OsmC family peroxiredoxin [Candidatus Abyssobacteria bacterium SURF_5]|uniref:OsmC family peroxiredoxin n=1 Tax=Abyssobacteria bacterium (strain SURF_5) TaxID=2093360 RepID=A0A3A4PC57_ABYX5|nr:MAG: OsmC family peroxiredoxin [Candidatus Abyssubacteria bacterium SURF_5]